MLSKWCLSKTILGLRVCKFCSSQNISCLQDSVFQDLGEGILENALQVVIVKQCCSNVCEPVRFSLCIKYDLKCDHKS